MNCMPVLKNHQKWDLMRKKIGTKACGTIVTANSGIRRDPGASAEVMCHFVRETENGIELRSRFWLGWAYHRRKTGENPAG